MRPIRTLVVVAGAFIFSTAPAFAAKTLPELKNVASTDDCFTNYSDAGKHCELSYCLGSLMGDQEQSMKEDFEGCSSRTLASMPVPEEEKRGKK